MTVVRRIPAVIYYKTTACRISSAGGNILILSDSESSIPDPFRNVPLRDLRHQKLKDRILTLVDSTVKGTLRHLNISVTRLGRIGTDLVVVAIPAAAGECAHISLNRLKAVV